MADLSDQADALRDEHLARALARIDPSAPEGVAGECDDCGEDMPRLVDGRCGYCRDGRPHPFERSSTPRPATGAPARMPPPPVKEETMPNAPGSKAISFVASGDLLSRILAQAEIERASPAALVKTIVEAALRDEDARMDAAERTLRDLATLPLADLLDELRDRVDRAAQNDALLTRAEQAEAKLASIAATLAPAAGAAA